jgi:hypothetical protein
VLATVLEALGRDSSSELAPASDALRTALFDAERTVSLITGSAPRFESIWTAVKRGGQVFPEYTDVWAELYPELSEWSLVRSLPPPVSWA